MAKAKLNQIIAVEKGAKGRVHQGLTELYHITQKPDLFNGFVKVYQKKNEEDESLPGEQKRVQYDVHTVLKQAERQLTEIINITSRKDWTNCKATADVKIDGKVIIEGAPVSFLLYMEKVTTDLRTLINSLPVLDPSEVWNKDENSGLQKTSPVQTYRTKKVSKPIVLYQATDKHPAQTQLIQEDIIAGFWNLEKVSGAIAKPEKDALLEKVEALLKALKEAREEANVTEEVDTPDVADAVFGYLFG